jgi:SAM-dependent methyltransferase
VSTPPADPTTLYTDRARDYDRYRPLYPPEAIDAVLHGIADPSSVVCADIGAGTGIASRLLAERGVRVVAVEPNEAMRNAGKAHDAPIVWQDGTGEATGLQDSSVDLVLCALSYHWLDTDRAGAEFARILRPGGRIALLWFDPDHRSPFAAAHEATIRRHCPNLPRRHAGWCPDVSARLEVVRRIPFGFSTRVGVEQLVGVAKSAGVLPRTGPVQEAIERDLRALHAAHADADGRVAFDRVGWVWHLRANV